MKKTDRTIMENRQQRYLSYMAVAGALLILVGAGSYVTGWMLSPYLYTAGAVLFAIPQLMARYEGKNIVIRRLRRQQIFGALLLMLTSVCMFTLHRNEWIVCLSVAAFLELYTAFRIPAELEKEKFN